MSIDIVSSSPKAIETGEQEQGLPEVGKVKYPFALLDKGQSFTIPIQSANRNSLKVLCHYYSKDEKRFILIKHSEYNIYEIARIE
jgi:hypothetical protein